MAATSSALQNLALELIARICACCCPEDLRNLANTCRTMFYVSRALRWHRISVNEDQYFEFREWLLAEERRTPDASAERDFDRYIRDLVLPCNWTRDTIAMVKLLAAIAPANLKAIVFGSGGRAAWYVDMKAMWTSPTMDDLMAPVSTMTIFNAPRVGLHFLLCRVPPSIGRPMSALLKSVNIKASPLVTDSWSDPTEPMGWPAEHGDEDVRVVMAADALEIDLREGIRDLVKFIYFPSLVRLTLYTGHLYSGDWQVVERLLCDCAPQLRTLRLYAGNYTRKTVRTCPAFTEGRLSERDTNFTTFSCLLTELSTVVVHWALVHHLEGINGLIFPGQVELVVENYDANSAEEDEYERAGPVLHLPHWRRVAFKYMLAEGSGSQALRAQRLTQLRNKAGVPWIVFVDVVALASLATYIHNTMLSTTLARTLRSVDSATAEQEIRANSYPTSDVRRFQHWAALSTELEQSLAECDTELTKLAEIKTALTARLNTLRSLQSPIRQLSDDDLSCIFDRLAHTLEDPSDRAAYFARTICKVCFRWNLVAHTMVNIWTYLRLQHNRLVPAAGRTLRRSQWAHFPYQVSLCRAAPIHVKWDYLGGFEDLSQLAGMWKDRFASLVVYMPWSNMSVLSEHNFRCLRRLHLVLFHSQGVGLAALGSLSHLEDLRLCGDGPTGVARLEDAFFCLPSLRHLRVDMDPPLTSSYIEHSLAGSSLNLVTLHIKTGLIIDCPPTPAHPITLPRLIDLLLESNACSLLRSLWPSMLKVLCLRDVNVRDDLKGSLFEALHAMLATANAGSTLTSLSLGNVTTSAASEGPAVHLCLSLLSNVTTILVDPGLSTDDGWNIGDVVAHTLTVTADAAYMPNLQVATFGHCRTLSAACRTMLEDTTIDIISNTPPEMPFTHRLTLAPTLVLCKRRVLDPAHTVAPLQPALFVELFPIIISFCDRNTILAFLCASSHFHYALPLFYRTVHVRTMFDYHRLAMKAHVVAPLIRELVIHHHGLLSMGATFTNVHTIIWASSRIPFQSNHVQTHLPKFLSQFPNLHHLRMDARPYNLCDVDIGLRLAAPTLRTLAVSFKTISPPFFLAESVASYPNLRELTICHHFFAQFSSFTAEYFRRNAPRITTLNFMQGLSWASLNELLSVTPPLVTELGLGLFPANAYVKPLSTTASDTLRRLRVLKVDMRRGNDKKRREWLSLADFLHTEREKGNLAALQKLRIRVMTRRMSTVALAGNWCFALFDSGDGLCILDWHVWLHQALGKTCVLEIVLIIDFPRHSDRAHDLVFTIVLESGDAL
ncbi:hypothetical protein EV715DRAFT_267999 [Schizophyllum commune]